MPSHKERARNQKWLWEYLEDKGCDICGESSPIFLEFDHRDTLEKDHDVSKMVSKGYAIASIKREIEKCDILCVRCHRFKTAETYRWYSSFIDWDNPDDIKKYL